MNTPNTTFNNVSSSSIKLYDPQAVMAATFLGTPLAGSVIMAMNYRRMGRTGAAATALVLGGLTSLVVLCLALALPPRVVGMAVSMPLVFAMFWLAKRLQGAAFAAHIGAGGMKASHGKALGVGLICLVLFGGTVLAASGNSLGKRVAIGSKDEVYYRDGITQQDAIAVGNQLKTIGYLSDRGVTVALSAGPQGKVISFVVKEGIWNDATMLTAFETVGRQVAPKLGGLPLTVRLTNSEFEVKKELSVK